MALVDAAWDRVSKEMIPLKARGAGVRAGAQARDKGRGQVKAKVRVKVRAVEAVALGAAKDAAAEAEEAAGSDQPSRQKKKPRCLKHKLPPCKNA
jgi:hypothetical protein